ncbi:Murinoglobulin-1, partial [Geodia barretti]
TEKLENSACFSRPASFARDFQKFICNWRSCNMRSLVLLAALLVAVTAQAPPHMLFKPQRYFVGTEASFSLTSYASESFSVTLKLTYEACTCGRSQVCLEEVVYDDDTKTVYPATDETNGQPAVLKVQLPSLGELESHRYYISMSSSEGHTFLNRQFVSFFGESNGHMLVKTDKPIYKPAQTVNICVVFLDASLRPHSAESTAQVVIRDSRFKQILKTTVTIPAGDGVGCMDIQLSDEPNLGTWTVGANYLIERGDNQCQFYFSSVRGSCRFKVDEFVLPRFEVEMTGPNQIQRTDNVIEGTVTGTYTFGERVDGTVRVNATLTSSSRRESIPFYDTTVPLKNGEFTFRFTDDAYKSKVLYRYDPFCVKSTILIVAEVTERGRNATQSTSLRIPLVSNPISLSFTDSPTIFRPGIDYTIKGKATQADGSPAASERVKVTATANNGRKTLLDKTVRTDANGAISQTVKLGNDINCLKFTMSPVVVEGSCDNQAVCFSPSPMYSPTNSFLQLTHVSPSAEITPNSNARVTATANNRFRVLHMMVIGQGNVLLHTSTFSTNSRNGVTAMTVDLPVTHAGVPRVKVLGVVAREDGELVADLIEIPVTCQLENQVGVSFGTGEAEPGDQVSVVTTASPNSVVVLGVIDKSLSLLADACKSVDTNNVCGLLRRLTGRSLPAGGSCSTESDSACCPAACSEPAKRAVTDIFNAAGVSLDSNMFQPRPPFVPPPPNFNIPFGRPEGDFFFDDVAARPAAPTALPLQPEAGPPLAPEPEEESELRDFFPETWIWEILRTNASGIAVHNSEVPDTITTWNAEAFAISGQTGLGISPLTALVAKKDVFVSLELPYSIIFQETVTVTPIIFNFGRRQDIDVRVSIEVDDDLELLERQVPENGLVRVSKGTGTPFNIKLKPRAIGLLPITICIRSSAPGGNGPCIDAVRKTLFIKPGCERFQITTNVYASNSSGEHCFNYELPTCVIPGSSKATISVTGDLMSPPDLTVCWCCLMAVVSRTWSGSPSMSSRGSTSWPPTSSLKSSPSRSGTTFRLGTSAS